MRQYITGTSFVPGGVLERYPFILERTTGRSALLRRSASCLALVTA
jgi:hypothetical protein